MRREPKLQQFTIGLVSDCPIGTVHAGKCFKVLTDSDTTVSLMCTSLYNMIEDCYKTCLLPAALNLQQHTDHPCLPWEKQLFQLFTSRYQISNFCILLSCVINYLDADFHFAIDLQKWYSLSYARDSDRHLFILREGSFLTYTRSKEDLHNSALVKSTLKIPLVITVQWQSN